MNEYGSRFDFIISIKYVRKILGMIRYHVSNHSISLNLLAYYHECCTHINTHARRHTRTHARTRQEEIKYNSKEYKLQDDIDTIVLCPKFKRQRLNSW